jgi:hypothetical protein
LKINICHKNFQEYILLSDINSISPRKQAITAILYYSCKEM